MPPFGFVLDYLAYGGLYREVWLDVRGADVIEDVFVTTPTLTRAEIALLPSPAAAPRRRVTLLDAAGAVCAMAEGDDNKYYVNYSNARPWSLDEPNLYSIRAELLDASGAVTDEKTVRFGFRTAEFRRSGFYLNGERVFLRGLNRHQCYPYMGYAAPESAPARDARILKEELCCTAVRTSHYPQSRHFIDACDELGLLVFTELPGWQHIGDAAWKRRSVENVREMVTQYRNHPSIVLWGVRINESLDDDEFYRETNALAHSLDPSRQTSGVRYFEKSHLLEDVYAYNDFSHDGTAPGAKKRSTVTPDMDKPYLISECNGHMFPTKSFDPWEKRQEHALRHARVQNAAASDGEISGCFGWVMFDYPTHKDFGSGDRVCYHGVMDAFRNPKLAAALYASQGDKTPVLEIGSSMDIGDYPAGNIGDIWAFTNAEEVALYKNDRFVASFRTKGLGRSAARPCGDRRYDRRAARNAGAFPARQGGAAAKMPCFRRKERSGRDACRRQGAHGVGHGALQAHDGRRRGALRKVRRQLGRRGDALALRCPYRRQDRCERDARLGRGAAHGSAREQNGAFLRRGYLGRRRGARPHAR